MLAAACCQAQPNGGQPPSVKALDQQGWTFMQEFKVCSDVHAFAVVAGDQSVAVHVTRDGNAIVGTRLDSKGNPLDEDALVRLVAKPIVDKA